MKKFMDEDFLLETESAKVLYHKYAKNMPIIDFHNHLSPKEIYENENFENISKAWLGGDHYKWRLMRAFGIEEEYITGNGSDEDKFEKWSETVPYTLGNPLYHWTHLELQRYFNIEETLSPKSKDSIYKKTNDKLQKEDFKVRNLLVKMKVKGMGTTDDPIDDLKYHKLLRDENFEIDTRPTFRPEKIVSIEKNGFLEYLNKLSEVVGYEIDSLDDLEKAVTDRVEYFDSVGCKASDNSLDDKIYLETTKEEVEIILKKRINNEEITEDERTAYKGYFLEYLGREYAKHDWVMQLHVGALRNNSQRMFEKLGADHGFDSMDDFNYAKQLSGLLNALDYTNELPKTVLYCMNGKDYGMLASLAGDFQDSSHRGKIQFGSAWWFLDTKRGMEEQIETLASMGLLSTFIGMLTDSRSFLSFPRHEYFRRILCNIVGKLVNNGEYPNDIEFVGQIIQDICYNNAKEYFGY